MREVIRAELLPIDPYRTTYSNARSWKSWAIVGGGLLLLILPAYLGFILISDVIRPAPPTLNVPDTKP